MSQASLVSKKIDVSDDVRSVIWAVIRIAGPSFFTLLCSQLIYQINLYYAATLKDEAKIAAVGLGTSLINVLPFAVIIGIATVLETLVGQAYGAKQY